MKRYYYIFLALFLALASCRKEYEPITFKGVDGTALVPLADTELTVDRLVQKNRDNDQFEIRSDDGLVVLIYKARRKELVTDYYLLPEILFNEQVTIEDILDDDPALSLLMGVNNSVTASRTEVYTKPFAYPLELGMSEYKSELDYVTFKNGVLTIEVDKNLAHGTEIDFLIPGLSKDGVVFETTIVLSPQESNDVIPVDLAGYRLDFKENGTPNEFDLEGQVKIISQAGNLITRTDGVDISLLFTSLEYNVVFGQVGEFVIDTGVDSMQVNAFDNLSDVDFRVKSPKVLLNTYVSTGAPSVIFLDELSMASPNQTPVSLQLDKTEFEIEQLLSINNKSDSAFTQEVFTNESISTGPNFTDALRSGKKEIITATRYKVGDADLQTDFFITEESFIATEFVAELPLEVNLQNYQVVDTVDNELQDLEDITNDADLSNMKIRVFYINSFPVEMDVNIIFLDENDRELDRAFEITNGDTFIGAPDLNDKGETLTPFQGRVIFDIDQELFDNMIIAEKMVVVASARTNQIGVNDYVRILDWNSLKVRMDFLTTYEQK